MRYINPYVRYIIVERCEGPAEYCGKPQLLQSFKEADKLLWRWAQTSPDTGAYDKCDVHLIFSDGESHKHRFDLQRQHIGKSQLIQTEIDEEWRFGAGLWKPAWMNDEKYAQYLADMEDYAPGRADRLKEVLETYQLTTIDDERPPTEEERDEAEREDRARLVASMEA